MQTPEHVSRMHATKGGQSTFYGDGCLILVLCVLSNTLLKVELNIFSELDNRMCSLPAPVPDMPPLCSVASTLG